MRRAVTTLAAVVALVGTLPPAPGGAISEPSARNCGRTTRPSKGANASSMLS